MDNITENDTPNSGALITHYAFGEIVVSGNAFSSDLKIINGLVVSGWWRKTGHFVDIDDVADVLVARPRYLVIGTGKPGLMKSTGALKKELERLGIELVEQPTASAVLTFNRLYGLDRSVCAGFHLTC